jgi:hypothetical protein
MSPEQVENWLRKFDNIAKSQDVELPRAYCVPAKKPVKLSGADIAKMRHMRREGFTITEISRAVKCTWRTAWSHTKASVRN